MRMGYSNRNYCRVIARRSLLSSYQRRRSNFIKGEEIASFRLNRGETRNDTKNFCSSVLVLCLGIFCCIGGAGATIDNPLQDRMPVNAVFSSAQSVESSEPVTGDLRNEEIDQLNAILEKDPNNVEHHLRLAELYASLGQGTLAIAHAQKALALSSVNDDLVKAYRLEAMGYYHDGQFQKSVEAIQMALKIAPEDQAVLGFQQMLVAVGEHVSSREAVEKISRQFGYSDPEKLKKAAKQEGIGDVHLSRRYDYIDFDFGRLRFKTPKGWLHRENIKVSPFTKALLVYNKFASQEIPQIGVVKDQPAQFERTAVEFSFRVKHLMEQKNIPGLKISDPIVIVVNGYSSSFMEITSPQTNSKSAWYQFLIGGGIVSVQYTNTIDQYAVDLPVVKRLVEGMTVELKKQKE